MSNEPKNVKITTRKGIASWPRLDTPDTKFKKEGQYSVKLILKGDDADDLIAQISKVADDAYEANKDKINELKAKEKNPKKRAEITERADLPYREVYGDDEQPTGEYEFNFKMTASGVSKKTGKPWTRKPAVFDAAGKPIKDVAAAKIGGGSVVKIGGELRPFYTAGLGAGVSLALDAVQVIECRSFGDRSAAAYGFGAEEGFSADEVSSEAADAGFKDESSSEPSNGDF